MDNVKLSTFAEAARSLGLFGNESEAEFCMSEAIADLCSPYQLRTLFVILVSEGAPANILFEQNFVYMAKDMKLKGNLTDDMAKNELLCDIQSRLEACGKTMESVGLPEPQICLLKQKGSC